MIILDYGDKRPIYEQVAGKLQNLIVSGVLEAESKLPSVRSLAVDLSINPNTIQRAYAQLESDGYIYSVKGVGNFVRSDDDITAKQREKEIDSLKNQIIRCQKIGITRDEIVACVDTLY